MQLTLWTRASAREVADRPPGVENRHPLVGSAAADAAGVGCSDAGGVGADMAPGATLGPPVPEVDPQPLGEATSAGPLAVRPFRWLFGGQAASTLGDRLVMVAMPFAVLSIDGAGASDVGLVLGAGALSLGGFVLVGGVWADRLPRRATMLGSDLVRAVLQAAAATLLLTGNATVASLVVVQLLFGAAEAFFRPAMLALIPELLEPDSLQPANALLALSSNISMVIDRC